MALEQIKSRLKRLNALVEGWNDDDISALERDLALEHLRAMYDSLSMIGSAAARQPQPQPAGGDTIAPTAVDTVAAVAAVPVPTASIPQEADEPATLIDDPIDIDALLGLSSADDRAETMQLSPAEPEPIVVPAATEPEPAAISEVATDPIVEPEPVEPEPVEPVVEPAVEPEEPAIAEPVAEIETAESVATEPETETESLPEPAREESVAEPVEEPAAEPVEKLAAEPVEESKTEDTVVEIPVTEEPAAAAEEPATEEPAAEPAKAPMGGLFDINEIPIRAKRRRNVMISLYEEPAKPLVRDDSPASTVVPVTSASSTPVAVPVAAEADAVREDRNREDREPATEPVVAESVAEPTAVPAEESVAVASVEPTVEPDVLPEQPSVQPQPKRYSAPVTPTPAPTQRLADVLGEEVTTLADSMIDDRSAVRTAATMRIDDLRSAIGINDKFLMIRDLFNGDGQMYENTITTLNEFDDLDECMIYIVENFAWNPDSDGARLLMGLIQRKLA